MKLPDTETTSKIFTDKIRTNFPEIYHAYKTKFTLDDNIDFVFGIFLLIELIIGKDVKHYDYVKIIGITDELDFLYDDKKVITVETMTSASKIKLDFFYKYIENNIDLIHFRLL